jgi:hypothetical protein
VLGEVLVGMVGVEVLAGDGEDPECLPGQLVADARSPGAGGPR